MDGFTSNLAVWGRGALTSTPRIGGDFLETQDVMFCWKFCITPQRSCYFTTSVFFFVGDAFKGIFYMKDAIIQDKACSSTRISLTVWTYLCPQISFISAKNYFKTFVLKKQPSKLCEWTIFPTLYNHMDRVFVLKNVRGSCWANRSTSQKCEGNQPKEKRTVKIGSKMLQTGNYSLVLLIQLVLLAYDLFVNSFSELLRGAPVIQLVLFM